MWNVLLSREIQLFSRSIRISGTDRYQKALFDIYIVSQYRHLGTYRQIEAMTDIDQFRYINI